MALFVQKFGGTSVGSIDRIKEVAKKVVGTRAAGHQVVVVLSAMGKETDRLLGLSRELVERPSTREYSMLVSTGEQVSIALLAMALMALGCEAQSFTGPQAGIVTDKCFRRARIQDVDCTRLKQSLADGFVPVVAGFQGRDEDNNITTLGRGGSDTTAVALAGALAADECQIYTDVDGVYTTDPRIVPDARRIDRITFEEMLELSSLGAQVLQIRAMELAGRHNVPLRVLSSFRDCPGTLITYEDASMDHKIVAGIAFNRSEAKLTILGVPDVPGIAGLIIGRIGDADIDIDMILQNVAEDKTTNFTFTVHREEFSHAMTILKTVKDEVGARDVVGDPNIAKLSIVGVGMRSNAGVASSMFRALAGEGINLQMIATSEIKISVIIDEKYLELGVRALHSAFKLSGEAEEEQDPLKI